MFQRSRPGSRLNRKRHQEQPAQTHSSQNLVFEDPELPRLSNNVVDDTKVKQYIHKLLVPDDQNGTSCIKLVMSDSESDYFAALVQEELQKEFGVSSISISEKSPLNVDRIVTVYGNLKQTLGLVLFMAFLLNSSINNMIKVEPFTLKSHNYHLDVLVECTSLEMEKLASRFPAHSIDYSAYNLNRNLHIATLRGDFLSLFNSLIYIYLRFSYKTYTVDSSIKLLNVIGVHDGDNLISDKSKQFPADNKDEVLKYLYGRSFLDS